MAGRHRALAHCPLNKRQGGQDGLGWLLCLCPLWPTCLGSWLARVLTPVFLCPAPPFFSPLSQQAAAKGHRRNRLKAQGDMAVLRSSSKAAAAPSSRNAAFTKVSPYGVVVTLICLLLVATTLFFFAPPDNMKNDSTHNTKTKNVVGFWGPVTAEIDWCEYNHRSSMYVAEPENSYSSLLYSCLGLIAYILHYPIMSLDPSYRAVVLFHNLNLIGMGSTAFHATLQYEFQLFDGKTNPTQPVRPEPQKL